MDRMQSGRGGCGLLFNMQPEYCQAARQAIGTCGTYPCNFRLNLVLAEGYEDITTCGTYLCDLRLTVWSQKSNVSITQVSSTSRDIFVTLCQNEV